MNIFEDQTNGQPQGDDQTQIDYLNELIKEKGEQWKDVNVLAKGKYDADQHIKRLEAEMADLREQNIKAITAQEILEQLQQGGAARQEPARNDGAEVQNTTGQEVDLKDLVLKTLEERTKADSSKANVEAFSKAMSDKFGYNAQSVLRQKASEFGVPLETLQELSRTSPQLALAAIGVNTPTQNKGMGQGTVNSTGSVDSNKVQERAEYWKKMRIENPREFRKPSTYKLYMEERGKLGF